MRIIILLLALSLNAQIVVDTTQTRGRLYRTYRKVYRPCSKVDLSKCDSVYRSKDGIVCLCNSSWTYLTGYKTSNVITKVRDARIFINNSLWCWLDSGTVYAKPGTLKSGTFRIESHLYSGKVVLKVQGGKVSIKSKPTIKTVKRNRVNKYNALGRFVKVKNGSIKNVVYYR